MATKIGNRRLLKLAAFLTDRVLGAAVSKVSKGRHTVVDDYNDAKTTRKAGVIKVFECAIREVRKAIREAAR